MISTAEETATSQAQAAEAQPKATKEARVAQQRAHAAPKKRKSRKKSAPAKNALKGVKKVTGPRNGSKTNKVLDLLKRPGGVTAKELMKATGWQAHSVRGFLSTSAKKQRIKIESAKNDAGERTYSFAN